MLYSHLIRFARVALPLVLFCLLAASRPGHIAEAAGNIAVNTTTDEFGTGANCALREAVQSAITDSNFGGCTRSGTPPYTINIPAGTYNLTLTGSNEEGNATGDIDLTVSMTLIGAGQGVTIIDGQAADRIFDVNGDSSAGDTVTLQDMTVRNGSTTDFGGGIDVNNIGGSNVTFTRMTVTSNTTTGFGGGIRCGVSTTCTVNDNTITNNSAGTDGTGSGGGLNCTSCAFSMNNTTVTNNSVGDTSGSGADAGGGLALAGTNTQIVTNSTFSNNRSDSDGGGIDSAGTGTVSISNTTISGNQAKVNGGGLNFDNTGSLTLSFVTITNNTADSDTGGTSGDGGGLYRGGSVALTLRNSIVQGNSDLSGAATADCGGTITSGNYNVIGSGTGCPTDTNTTTASALLGGLADNGGPTLTHFPAGGSSAIERVPVGATGCTGGGGTLDQRGAYRANGAGAGNSACDSGAVEGDSSSGPTAITLSRTTLSGGAQPLPTILLLGLLVLAVITWRMPRRPTTGEKR